MAHESTLNSFGEAPRVLVVGGSRGIGLAFARLLAPTAARLWIGSRRAPDSEAVAGLIENGGAAVSALAIDVESEDSVRAAAGRIAADTDRLDLVINCAGLLHEGEHLGPERKLAQIEPANLEKLFRVHAVGPQLLAKHLEPLLPRRQRFVFASLSARVGSIGDNRLGGWYAYRASKAAQNQLLRTLAIELRRVNRQACCLLLHPGTVDTPLSAPFQGNVAESQLFSPARAAAQLLGIIASAEASGSARFLAWDGSEIPW